MADASRSVVEALDNIRNAIASGAANLGSAPPPRGVTSEEVDVVGGIQYPGLATGPVEKVLVFTSRVKITLQENETGQYFSSEGTIADLAGNVIPGGVVKTALPTAINSVTAAYLLTFPDPQEAPFDEVPPPPETGPGKPPAGEILPPSYTKQSYDFGDGNSLATVGAAFPKISYLKSGGAQFWVGFLGAITQGGGDYEGARGMASFDGSAFFKEFPSPDNLPAIIELLQAGFEANVGVYFKLVPGDDLAPLPGASEKKEKKEKKKKKSQRISDA